MPKVNASQILKEGAELKVIKIDYNDESVKALLVKLREKQDEILRFKRVKPETLRIIVGL